jgi:hypothetical protein
MTPFHLFSTKVIAISKMAGFVKIFVFVDGSLKWPYDLPALCRRRPFNDGEFLTGGRRCHGKENKNSLLLPELRQSIGQMAGAMPFL